MDSKSPLKSMVGSQQSFRHKKTKEMTVNGQLPFTGHPKPVLKK